MKKSQFIAILVMFAVASILIWIGAFGKDNIKDSTPAEGTGSVMAQTLKPINTAGPATETPAPGDPTDPTGEPSGSTAPATETNAPTEEPATPTPTSAPATFPVIKNEDFAKLPNEFDYWGSTWKTGADNQNIPVFNDNLKRYIGDVDYIFLNAKSESEYEVYLTFDVNYDYGVTGKILDTLKSYNVKATFFITYDYIVNYPDTVKRMKDEGHLIGTRGPISENVLKSSSAEQLAEEFMKVEREYQKLFGENERMLYYRPDYFSQRSLKVAETMGYKIVFKTYNIVADEGEWDRTKADTATVTRRFWERCAYDGSVPGLNISVRVSQALEGFLKECTNNNVTFKRLDA